MERTYAGWVIRGTLWVAWKTGRGVAGTLVVVCGTGVVVFGFWGFVVLRFWVVR